MRKVGVHQTRPQPHKEHTPLAMITWNAAFWRHKNRRDSMKEGLPSPPIASSRPRLGSRTVKKTSTPSSKPGTPSAKKAARQPSAWATAPAKSAPIHAPIGAPRASTDNAIGRRSGGKQSDTIDVEGGVAPASPTPTPMRPNSSCQYVCDTPHNTVNPDQMISAAATMLRRFERSANQAMGIPKTT